ncbi:hypothetical protein AAG906_003843 [Vitis piasezkii]
MAIETPTVRCLIGESVDDAACISASSFSYAELEEKLKRIPPGSDVAMPSAKMFEVVETLVSGLRGMAQQHDLFTDLLRTADYMKAFASQRKNSEDQLRLRLEEAEASLSAARGDNDALRAELAEAKSREESVDARLHEAEDEMAHLRGEVRQLRTEREELEADYQKQVDDMFFFGYRCCMKKHGIKRDVPSIPPASGPYFAIVMSGCPLNDCVHTVCEGEGSVSCRPSGCEFCLWLLLAHYFEDNAVWSMNSDVRFEEIRNAMLSNVDRSADDVFPYELGSCEGSLVQVPPIKVKRRLAPGSCVPVWDLRAKCLSGGKIASLMGREALCRQGSNIAPCAHPWPHIPSGRVLPRVANRYRPGAWTKPDSDHDDREAPSTHKVHHSFHLVLARHHLAFHGQYGLELDSKFAQFDSPLKHCSG